jgi:hypothetical protein
MPAAGGREKPDYGVTAEFVILMYFLNLIKKFMSSIKRRRSNAAKRLIFAWKGYNIKKGYNKIQRFIVTSNKFKERRRD